MHPALANPRVRAERAAVTLYTRRALAAALSLLLGCGGASTGDITPPVVVDSTAPTVSAVTPSSNAVDVAVSAVITVTFSEPVNPVTVTTSTLSVTAGVGAAPIAGTVAATGSTATFTPSAPLSAGTSYTVTITTAVKDLAGNALTAPYVSAFRTVAPPDVIAPTIIDSTPGYEAINVALNVTPSVTFSEPMRNATLTTATITLTNNTTGALVPGTITISGNKATFVPNAPLLPSTQYAMRILTGVADLAGNALAAPTVWSFRTIDVLEVAFVLPVNNATGVAQDAGATAGFSLPVDRTTFTPSTVTLTRDGSGAVPGIVLVNAANNTASFFPDTLLLPNTRYTAKVGAAVRDSGGNALGADYAWSFTTGVSAPDVTAPEVIAAFPGNATGVAVGSIIEILLSERMANRALNTNTVTLVPTDGGAPVAGRLALFITRFQFIPTAALRPNTRYTFTISTAATDASGNPLAAPFTMTFTTAP